MKLFKRKNDHGILSCREVGKVLQAFVDDEADEQTVDLVDAHLELCRRCGMELVVYRQIKESLARSHDDVPEIALRRLRNFGERLAAGSD